jgi:hypothetical protein
VNEVAVTEAFNPIGHMLRHDVGVDVDRQNSGFTYGRLHHRSAFFTGSFFLG